MYKPKYKKLAETQSRVGNEAIALCLNAPLIAEIIKRESRRNTIRITNYETQKSFEPIVLGSPTQLSFSRQGKYLCVITYTVITTNNKVRILIYTFSDTSIELLEIFHYPNSSYSKILDLDWIDENHIFVSGINPKNRQGYIDILNIKERIIISHKNLDNSPEEDWNLLDADCFPSGSVGFLYSRGDWKKDYRIKIYQITKNQSINLVNSVYTKIEKEACLKGTIHFLDCRKYFAIQSYFGDYYLFDSNGNILDKLETKFSGNHKIYNDTLLCKQPTKYKADELKIFSIKKGKFYEWCTIPNLQERNGDICATKINDRTIIAINQGKVTEIWELQDLDIIYLESEKSEEQLEAIQSLAQRKFSPAIPALVDLVNRKYEAQKLDIAQKALEALIEINDSEALPYLIRILGQKSKTDFQKNIFSAIKKFPFSKIEQAIYKCLESTRKTSLRGATWLLERMPRIKALDALCIALSDIDSEIRQSVARALGKRADLRACSSLLAYLNDEDLDTRRYVQEALVKCLASNGLLTETVERQLSLPINITIYAREIINTGQIENFEKIGESKSGQFLNSLAKACVRDNQQPVAQILNAVDKLTVQSGASDKVSLEIALTIALICANVMRQQKSWQGAISIYHRAVELAQQTDVPHLEWRIWYAAGECAEQNRSDRQALGSFQKAMDIIDWLWFALLEEDKLIHFFQEKAKLYDLAELCCLRLGYKALALEYREKAKTRYLGDLIARRQKDPEVKLERELRDFWRQLDKARPVRVPVDLADSGSQKQLAIIGVEWGEDESQSIKPSCLAEFEEAVQDNNNLKPELHMLKAIWKLIAKLSSIEDEAESIYERLQDIFQVLEEIQSIVKAGELPLSTSEKSNYINTFQELAEQLSEFQQDNSNIPFYAFREWGTKWLEEICEGHNLTERELLLDAVVEALNMLFHQSPVIGLAIESDGDLELRERLIFTIASQNTSIQSESQRTKIIETALDKVTKSRWHYVSRLARGEISSFKEIETALANHPHTAQLEFSITEEGTIVYIIRGIQHYSNKVSTIPNLSGQENLAVFTFPEVKLSALNQMLIEEENSWLNCYQNRTMELWMSAMDEAFEWLYTNLIAPIKEQLKRWDIKQLMILPNRSLNLIPFSALYYKDKENKKHYLIEEYEISYAPSSTLQQICRERAVGRKLDESLTAIKNPTKDLRYAEQEVEILSQHFSDSEKQILSGQKASLEQVKKIRPKSFYHFACHGIYQWQQPLESALVMAQSQKLELSSLFEESITLNSTILVTLSACETAVSDPEDLVDEFIGLAAGFLFAGTPWVISSLWAVDDLATMLLITKFYDFLLETKVSSNAKFEFSKAMQKAQNWLRQLTVKELEVVKEDLKKRQLIPLSSFPVEKQILDNDYPFQHPYYWASFIVAGIGVADW